MPTSFPANFGLVLKALSLNLSQVAAQLNVDKSTVGRWSTGAVTPSIHNISLLTALVAARIPGFTTLDWEADLQDLAALLGVDPARAFAARASRAGLPLPIMDEVLATTALRGSAYECFYRVTRPWAQGPGRFLHDYMLVRMDASGLLRFQMASAGVTVEGWVLPLQQQLFVVGTDRTSGALAFGIFNGVNGLRAKVIDGLVLNCALDPGRSPTSTPAILERIEELSGDSAADDRRFTELAAMANLAPEGSVSDAFKSHLARDIGPAQLASGGEWMLSLPLARSMSQA